MGRPIPVVLTFTVPAGGALAVFALSEGSFYLAPLILILIAMMVTALALPRFGRGNPEVDAFGDQIIGRIARTAVEVLTHPAERTASKMLRLAEGLGTVDRPFGGFQVQPGVGSLENYRNMSGASADGRLSGDPPASDLSRAPSFGDLPINPNEAPLLKVKDGYSGRGVEAMWDGAPTDFNIREDLSKRWNTPFTRLPLDAAHPS
jgi:hypothetical protein